MSDINPVLIAIIAVAIAFFLLSGLRKPARAAADSNNNNSAAARGGARAAAGGKPMVSVSGGCVVRFGAGGPHVPPEAAQALRSLAAGAAVHLVTQLPRDTDELERQVMAALDAAGVFGAGGCDRRRAIFCSTEDGRGSIVRQLAPALHVDESAKVVSYLAPHVPRVVKIGASLAAASSAAAEIPSAPSLAEYVVQMTAAPQ